MNKFLIFCFSLVRIMAILSFALLVIKNHPFMALLLIFIVFSVGIDVEQRSITNGRQRDNRHQ